MTPSSSQFATMSCGLPSQSTCDRTQPRLRAAATAALPICFGDASKAAFKKGEWNKFRIVVKGDRYQSWVNGVPTADFRQTDDPEGYIGFQVHGIKKGAGPYSVRWRNVRLRETK